jgi:hypothetical protein
MTLEEAENLVISEFWGYGGTQYSIKKAVSNYVTAHPKGKGIRSTKEKRLYAAARIVWAYITAPETATYPRNKQWRQSNRSTYSYPDDYRCNKRESQCQ